jgi:hypothetical protein
MKHLIFLATLSVGFTSFSTAQNLALLADKTPLHTSNVSWVKSQHKHKASTLGTIGGCTLVGGLGIYAWGYLKIGDANNQATPIYNPATGQSSSSNDNQSQINTGHTLETIGATLAIAGAAMIIVDMCNPHHRKSKVGVVAPQSNSLGLVYKF